MHLSIMWLCWFNSLPLNPNHSRHPKWRDLSHPTVGTLRARSIGTSRQGAMGARQPSNRPLQSRGTQRTQSRPRGYLRRSCRYNPDAVRHKRVHPRRAGGRAHRIAGRGREARVGPRTECVFGASRAAVGRWQHDRITVRARTRNGHYTHCGGLSVDLCSPNEDVGKRNRRSGVSFRGTLRGCEYYKR